LNKNLDAGNRRYMRKHFRIFHCIHIGDKTEHFFQLILQCKAPAFIPYDSTQGSPYYNQFMQVYEKEKVLTQQEKEAAIWWADDPEASPTPPGHSYYLATIAVRKTKPDLINALKHMPDLEWHWQMHFAIVGNGSTSSLQNEQTLLYHNISIIDGIRSGQILLFRRFLLVMQYRLLQWLQYLLIFMAIILNLQIAYM
jgi:hypothetical protein